MFGKVIQVGCIYPDKDGYSNRSAGRIYSARGIAPTIRIMGGGNQQPLIIVKMDGYKFRIRKLTPIEVFRLMDVDDKYIDIQTHTYEYDKDGNLKYFKGEPKQLISNSKLYQLAGNSIVVNCMTLMFDNLLYPTSEPERGDKLSLF